MQGTWPILNLYGSLAGCHKVAYSINNRLRYETK